jgi:hypothetical protein
VSVTASNMNVTIPAVQCTNNDTDTAAVTISRTSGLVTSEAGGSDSFTVALTSQPYGTVTLNLSVSDPNEVMVSPTQIQFDSSNWKTGVSVLVTGVDDAQLDFSVPFTIITQQLVAPSDPPYAAINPPDVSGVNLDNEVIPEPTHAWGGSGKGGCGLLGLELALPFLIFRLRRAKK